MNKRDPWRGGERRINTTLPGDASLRQVHKTSYANSDLEEETDSNSAGASRRGDSSPGSGLSRWKRGGKNIVELSTDIGGGAPKTSPVRRSGWAQEVGLEGEWPHDKGSQMSVKDLGLSPEDNREPRMGAEQGGWGYTAQLAEPGPVKAHQGVPQAWPGPAAAAAASPGNSLECKFCGCSPGLLNQKPRDFNKPPGDADASQTGELRTHPTPRLLLLTPPQHTVPAGSALR